MPGIGAIYQAAAPFWTYVESAKDRAVRQESFSGEMRLMIILTLLPIVSAWVAASVYIRNSMMQHHVR
jgi:hypothetical protein